MEGGKRVSRGVSRGAAAAAQAAAKASGWRLVSPSLQYLAGGGGRGRGVSLRHHAARLMSETRRWRQIEERRGASERLHCTQPDDRSLLTRS